MKATNETNFKDTGKLTRLDGKHRVSLGQAIRVAEASVSYRVLQNDLGQVLLDPVKIVPTYEAWIYEDPAHIQSIRRGIAQAETGQVVRMQLNATPTVSLKSKTIRKQPRK